GCPAPVPRPARRHGRGPARAGAPAPAVAGPAGYAAGRGWPAARGRSAPRRGPAGRTRGRSPAARRRTAPRPHGPAASRADVRWRASHGCAWPQRAALQGRGKSGQTGAWGKLVGLLRVGISQVIASATATLAGQRILLCVGGGIAAYKALELVRRLRDAGAQVQVAMTAGAQQFVTPLSFQALSGHPAR